MTSHIKKEIKALLKAHGKHGNYDYDPYMLGIYNGMELICSIIDERNAVYKAPPKKWLYKQKENDNEKE